MNGFAKSLRRVLAAPTFKFRLSLIANDSRGVEGTSCLCPAVGVTPADAGVGWLFPAHAPNAARLGITSCLHNPITTPAKPVRRHRRGRQVVAGAFMLVSAGCSTADYHEPVAHFAAATGNAELALAQLDEQVTQSYGATLEARILNRQAFPKPADQECQTVSLRCRLIIVSDSGDIETYPPEPAITHMRRVMAQIARYAASLRALLDADTASQVETHVNAALGNVQNLAETVAEVSAGAGEAPPKVPAFSTSAGAAANWFVGQYVERVKFKGLQRATKAAQPVVRNAADLFRTASLFASDVPRSALAEEVSLAVDTFRSARNEANLARLVQSAAKYDAFLTAAPNDLFQKLGAAHDALAASLQSDGATLTTAIARIETFAAEAEKLVDVMKDVRALFPAEQEG